MILLLEEDKMDWYAIFTMPNKELEVQKWISFFFDKSICTSIVPRRILTERKQGKKYKIEKVMFKGYVFINIEMNDKYYHKLKDISYVIKILGEDYRYSKISEEEMDLILKLTKYSEVIDYSKIYMKNSKVIVKAGPLTGMEGIIKKIDKRKNRATILINCMGEMKKIDLGVEFIDF